MDGHTVEWQLDNGVHQGNLEVGLEYPMKKACYLGKPGLGEECYPNLGVEGKCLHITLERVENVTLSS